MAEIAVLLMAYGTPRRPEDLESYYTHIRRGRPPEPEALADLRRRYDAIGGLSPLRELTEAQAAGLQAELEAREPGRFEVDLGLKHAPPFVEDTAAALAARHDVVVGLVLAPHASPLSVGAYHRRAQEAVAGDAIYLDVGAWYDHPGYVELLATNVRDALDRIPAELRARTHVLFTAHSLPAETVEQGDDYPVQLRRTAQLVTSELPPLPWRPSIAWQSAGRTAQRWLGPDVLEVIPVLAASHGVQGVVVCPCGFVADHLEVLYDVDIEARAVAADHGVHLERTAMPNAEPAFLAVLADLVQRAAVEGAP